MGVVAAFAFLRSVVMAVCFWLFLSYADGWVYALISAP